MAYIFLDANKQYSVQENVNLSFLRRSLPLDSFLESLRHHILVSQNYASYISCYDGYGAYV